MTTAVQIDPCAVLRENGIVILRQYVGTYCPCLAQRHLQYVALRAMALLNLLFTKCSGASDDLMRDCFTNSTVASTQCSISLGCVREVGN